jgi:ATP-dependent exoDNAse (exonuclease V) alpha subunit
LINDKELESIKSCVHKFKAEYKGLESKIDFLRKNCIAKEHLELKVGARVMMLKNTYRDQGIVNGSVGTIEKIEGGFPSVKFQTTSGEVVISVVPEIWTVQYYDTVLKNIVIEASMHQIPLILAWAITIHKSQGMTLDRIKCDLSRVFTYGQSYVALSRVKTLEGLFLEDINFEKIYSNKFIIDYYNQCSSKTRMTTPSA